MKIIYFRLSQVSKEYFLDQGVKGKDREIFGRDHLEAISKLRKILNFKRNTELYVGRKIPEELLGKIKAFCKDTKVIVKLEEDL